MTPRANIKHHLVLLLIATSVAVGVAVILMHRTSTELNDGKTVVVVAHLDDELLWFEPLLLDAHLIVQAAMPIGPAQLRAKPNAYRNYKGTNLLDKIVHAYPPIEQGEEFFETIVKPAIDPDISKRCLRDRRYGLDQTKVALTPLLRQAVAQGARRIVTHNPWGEYGHPQHRMLSRAIRELAVDQLNVDVWVLATVVTKKDGKDRRYIDILDLPDVTYSRLTFDTESFRNARNAFKKQIFFNTDIDTWTWDEGENDFPSGQRSYVRLVIQNPDTGAKDLVKSNPNLAYRIELLTGGATERGGDTQVTLLYRDCTVQ